MMFDRVTWRLLSLVQSNNRRSLSDLARDTGSSRSVVQRRLNALRRIGAIRRDVALLDRRLVGRLETFIVRFELRWEHRQSFDRFRTMVCELPEVQQCYITTGRLNCIALVLLPGADALDAFVARHFADNPLVRSYRTSLVVRELKVSLEVPVHRPNQGEGGPSHQG